MTRSARFDFARLSLALASALSLAGCGSEADDGASASSSQSGSGAGAAGSGAASSGAASSVGGDGGAGASGGAGAASGSGGATICGPGAVASCYSGPSGTDGVGICAAGERTCAEDGSGFGPCIGEVFPDIDDCTSLLDEDCDGATPPCPAAWAKAFGGSADTLAHDLAVDSFDNVVLVGQFTGTALFEGSTFSGADAGFTLRLDASGTLLDASSMGSAKIAYGVAVDGLGKLTRTGTRSVPVGPTTIDKLFVEDDTGLYEYGSNEARGLTAAIDDQGRTLVAGYFWGSVDYGAIGYSLCNNSNPDPCATIVQFDDAGQPTWKAGWSGHSSAISVALDASGNSVVAAGMRNNFSDGNITLPAVGGSDVLVVSYDPAGALRWARRFGDAEDQDAYDVAIDSNAHVLVVGSFSGTIDFGTGLMTSAGARDGFVVKLDDTGTTLYAVQFGGAGDELAHGIATDPSNNVLVTGSYDGPSDFLGAPLADSAAQHVLLAKLDPTLALGWAQGFANGEGIRVGADASGRVVLVGNFVDTIDFGTGALVNPGLGSNAFVVQFEP